MKTTTSKELTYTYTRKYRDVFLTGVRIDGQIYALPNISWPLDIAKKLFNLDNEPDLTLIKETNE